MRRYLLHILVWLGIVIPLGVQAHGVAVFLLPHQDDEMVCAGAIYDHLQQGDEVVTVMVTDGSASRARDEINKKLTKSGLLPIDQHAFSAARNDEYYRSMRALGVASDHILFANPGGKAGSDAPVYRDGSLTVAEASAVIQNIYDQYSSGSYHTVAARAYESLHQHPDHLALREALAQFNAPIEKYFYSDQVFPAHEMKLSTEARRAKRRALSAYYDWNPALGHYAVGMYSVHDRLASWRREKIEYVIAEVLPTPQKIGEWYFAVKNN